MRFVVLWGIELKLGIGVGDGPMRFESIFSERPHQRSKLIQRSSCFRNALWSPNLVGRTPYRNVVQWWGRAVMQGSSGVERGQIAQECFMATKFGRKNPWLKEKCISGVKGNAQVNRGQPWVKLLRNGQWPSYLVGRTSDWSVTHWWGRISCRGHMWSEGNCPKCLRPPNVANVALALEQKK